MNRFQVRRATVEDLPQLRTLWQMENLPSDSLEKRFTEFQVAQNDQGEIVAAIGLQMSEGQGRLHSEAIGWADLAEDLRAQLWPRLEAVARNQGLGRLWTALDAPFWKGIGFKKVQAEMLELLPAAFAEEGASWLALPLRAAGASPEDLEKQFAVLKAMSAAENEQLMERARLLKWIAMGLMATVFGAFAVGVVYYAWTRARLKKRRNGGL
jgi:N-acetylglutamate synthase-like GNAT family acetyltransferase